MIDIKHLEDTIVVITASGTLTKNERFLSERPEVDGIALPGMPTGTPGMSGPKTAPYEVLTLQHRQLGLYEKF